MSTHGPADENVFEFSVQTRSEIALALAAFMSPRTTSGAEQLVHAARRASGEARWKDQSADAMVVEVKRLVSQIPRNSGDVNKRVDALDKFVSMCIEAYLASAPKGEQGG
jgi:hypothetical protein